VDAAGRGRLVESAETTLNLIQTRERLVAGTVNRSAEPTHRTTLAARNELYTDMAAADSRTLSPSVKAMNNLFAATNAALGIPMSKGRPLARRDDPEHVARSVPTCEVGHTVKIVALQVEVPILVRDDVRIGEVVAKAVARVHDALPDTTVDLRSSIFVEYDLVQDADISDDLRKSEDSRRMVILQAVQETNRAAKDRESAINHAEHLDDIKAQREAIAYTRGGAR
jgi:hypothetical protein